MSTKHNQPPQQVFRQFAWNLAGMLSQLRQGRPVIAKPDGRR